MHEVALWLVSLTLALGLWFAVAGQKSAEVSVVAPLEFRNMPEGLELTGSVPRSLDVWVRGSPGMVGRLLSGEVYVPVDLAGAVSGARVVHVASHDVRVPYGVRIAAIRPAAFILTLERTMQRTVPVRAKLTGTVAPGYRVSGITVDPAEMAVAGPESRVAALEAVTTEAISVERAQVPLSREVSVAPPEPPLRVIEPRPVRVTVHVEPDTENKGH
jgi:YbbR domain-containing protein